MHEQGSAIRAVRIRGLGRPCAPVTRAELNAQHNRTRDRGRARPNLMDLMLAAFGTGYWAGLLLAVPAAGFLVRLFMIQRHCGHGSFFHRRRANDWVGRVIGVLTLTPYDFWRRSHALHHANSGNLDHRGFGNVDTLTRARVSSVISMAPAPVPAVRASDPTHPGAWRMIRRTALGWPRRIGFSISSPRQTYACAVYVGASPTLLMECDKPQSQFSTGLRREDV
jgi:hypothetical protein